MDPIIQSIITVVCAVIASSGFWAFLQKKTDKNDAKTRLLVGLGHDRIMYLGEQYLQRGEMTVDEYENLHDYLYVPYSENGGNGSAELIMKKVQSNVRIVPSKYIGD